MSAPTLRRWVEVLESLAPLALAEDWDKVGLLVEPLEPRPMRCTLLTVDLGQEVLDEALAAKADGIVAYHPPIFAPLERLRASEDRERLVLRLVRAGIAVHSPHTALDAAVGGVNDWLAEAFPGARVTPLVRSERSDDPRTGQGRLLELAAPLTLAQAIANIKTHLGLAQLHVAPAPGHAAGAAVRRVALCAGAGGSVLEDVDADLLWTGEMRHHDVLAARARGRSVVLCRHTNTERGALVRFAERLRAGLGASAEVRVSAVDADPLQDA